MMAVLPPADANRANSGTLVARLRAEIARDGPLGFARFMQAALYDAQDGYYSTACGPVFGAAGDFVTAPELGPVFARCLAEQCAGLLRQLPDADILECGAGSGQLALDLLQALQQLDCSPRRYLIDEISPAMRRRQRQLLATWHGATSIEWVRLPLQQAFSGVVLANEVADALPFHCLVLRAGHWLERCVGVGGDGVDFAWRELLPSDALRPLLPALPTDNEGYPDGYLTEFRCNMASWLCSLTATMERGLVLCVDYGYPRHEYLHPQRRMGTMLCHKRHIADDDPLRDVGLKDITAAVDFTALAEAAAECDLALCGYTTQAGFLLSLGAEKLAAGSADRKALASLLHPGAMGEIFKVIAFARGLQVLVAPPCRGFAMPDHRWRLDVAQSPSTS